MKLPKIPHPWWHAFFTKLEVWGSTASMYDGQIAYSWEDHRCSKCMKLYRLKRPHISQVYNVITLESE